MPAYRKRISERYGFFKAPEKQASIWVHSVSVGESIAIAPMVKELIKKYPDYRIVVTTMTPTGSAQVINIYGNSIYHVYAPYDLPFAINRFLDKITPKLAIFMETELWPNTIKLCRHRGIPTMIANARLSERSAKGYKHAGKIVAEMLGNITLIAVQHKDDGDRFVDLGLSPDKLHITGSLKYDIKLPEKIKHNGKKLRIQWLEKKPENTKIIIACSTHKDEEAQLLSVFSDLKEKNNNLLFVIVPRHPERFDEVAELCNQAGFIISRRSREEPVVSETDIILADTMGEMYLLLAACDITYMGGSLVPTGGHNFMEPAMLAMPQVSGPHVFNFQHVADMLVSEKALIIKDTSKEIAQTLQQLLDSPVSCKTMGNAAKTAVEREQGALGKHIQLVEILMK